MLELLLTLLIFSLALLGLVQIVGDAAHVRQLTLQESLPPCQSSGAVIVCEDYQVIFREKP